MGHGKHASVEVKGPGLAKLQKLVNQLNLNPEVKIGVLANAKNSRTGDALTNTDIAIINEFGSPKMGIPGRPFVGTTGDHFKSAWLTLMARTLGFAVDGKITPIQALEIVGQRAAGDMKRVLLQSMWEPNAPSTIRRKGSSHPLVDSRQLLDSISHEARAQGKK